MNRIQQLTQHVAQAPSAPIATSDHFLQAGVCRQGVDHAVFAPLHYEPNYAYPLIIWLHGPDDNERQLQRIMPLVSMRNYVAVAPRATQCVGSRSTSFSWNHSLSGIMDAEQRIFDCIDVVQTKFNVEPGRMFLAGFRCGGTMAFRIALKNPSRFAGVLSIGGPFPEDHNPLIHLNQVRHLPLFIAQGRLSQRYPVERTCAELRLFHAAGLAVTLRQYPCGDELSTQMLHDMNVWVMEQVTGVEMHSEQQGQPRPGEIN